MTGVQPKTAVQCTTFLILRCEPEREADASRVRPMRWRASKDALAMGKHDGRGTSAGTAIRPPASARGAAEGAGIEVGAGQDEAVAGGDAQGAGRAGTVGAVLAGAALVERGAAAGRIEGPGQGLRADRAVGAPDPHAGDARALASDLHAPLVAGVGGPASREIGGAGRGLGGGRGDGGDGQGGKEGGKERAGHRRVPVDQGPVGGGE